MRCPPCSLLANPGSALSFHVSVDDSSWISSFINVKRTGELDVMAKIATCRTITCYRDKGHQCHREWRRRLILTRSDPLSFRLIMEE